MSTQVFRPGLHPSPSDTYDLVNHSTCFCISFILIQIFIFSVKKLKCYPRTIKNQKITRKTVFLIG